MSLQIWLIIVPHNFLTFLVLISFFHPFRTAYCHIFTEANEVGDPLPSLTFPLIFPVNDKFYIFHYMLQKVHLFLSDSKYEFYIVIFHKKKKQKKTLDPESHECGANNRTQYEVYFLRKQQLQY